MFIIKEIKAAKPVASGPQWYTATCRKNEKL